MQRFTMWPLDGRMNGPFHSRAVTHLRVNGSMSAPLYRCDYPPINYTEADFERFYPEPRKPDDERSPFEVDRARVIHSQAFRRLQGKTQVFAPGQSDFFRTRLTHSLEAAQIAKGLAIRLGANLELCEVGALAHDIGHPPFGHHGETVLQERMLELGGFEANAQNFRVVCRLEEKSRDNPGLNLTRATLDAFFKYKQPFASERKKFHYADDEVADWLKSVESSRRAFECDIVNLADDIAYAVHDFEDGLQSGLITDQRAVRMTQDILKEAAFEEADVEWAIRQIREVMTPTTAPMPSLGVLAKEKTTELINRFIQAAIRVPDPDSASSPDRYAYRVEVAPDVSRQIATLKALAFRLIISDQRVSTLEARAETVLRALLEYYQKESSRYSYPPSYLEMFSLAANDQERARVACDYISGMTDEYAQRLYRRLFTVERSALHDF
jgi:dGTPase